MDIPIVVQRATVQHFEAVLAFVQLVDAEFVPPLSVRYCLRELVRQYLCEPGKACLLETGADRAIRAALLYELNAPLTSSAYLVFFAVRPDCRRTGLALRFRLAALEVMRASDIHEVTTRTWSTNGAMLALNQQSGFTCTHVVKDERGPGIDSVYFRRTL